MNKIKLILFIASFFVISSAVILCPIYSHASSVEHGGSGHSDDSGAGHDRVTWINDDGGTIENITCMTDVVKYVIGFMKHEFIIDMTFVNGHSYSISFYKIIVASLILGYLIWAIFKIANIFIAQSGIYTDWM